MKRGKQTYRILKEIRKQVAEANDIEFVTSECQHQGDCLDTCPKCESEVHYLEQQLEYKCLVGKAINILGISARIIAIATPLGSCTNTMVKQQDSIISISPKKIAPELIFGMAEGEEYSSYQGELMAYIEKNTQYPSNAISISGRAIVEFDAFIYDAKDRKKHTCSKSNGYFEIYLPRNHNIIVTSPHVETQNINKYKAPYINVVLLEENKISATIARPKCQK